MMQCDFSYKHYQKIMEGFLEDGYKSWSYDDYFSRKITGKALIIRHDIDRSIDKALDMAKIEYSLGISSTFFIRLHSNYYNPFSYNVFGKILQIADMNHRLALHSEAISFGKIYKWSGFGTFLSEMKIFEGMFGDNKIYAPHATLGSDGVSSWEKISLELFYQRGYFNVYEILKDKEWKYLSDSSGVWREGCLCQHREPNINVLTHPMWWYSEHSEIGDSII